MKKLLFYRESNNFDDILSDTNIKKLVRTKITFFQYLIIGFDDYKPKVKELDKVLSYIMLKYGEDLREFADVIPDRTPIPYKDYVPERKKKSLH